MMCFRQTGMSLLYNYVRCRQMQILCAAAVLQSAVSQLGIGVDIKFFISRLVSLHRCALTLRIQKQAVND